MSDTQERYVIAGRDKRKTEWKFHVISPDRDMALRSANTTQIQERELGNTRFEACIFLESDWDAGKRQPINAPRGFDFALRDVTAEVPRGEL